MSSRARVPKAGEEAIITARRAVLDQLREDGWNYPNDFRRDHLAAGLQQQCADWTADQFESAAPVRVAGRMMSRRVLGKAAFVDLQDASGQIQLHLRRDVLQDAYDDFRRWDIGDLLGASGTLFRTRTNELSIRVDGVQLLSKALRPLPEKYHGLVDRELRYRRRYLDLIANAESRRIFRLRSRVISFIRGYFEARDFMEVETPMMHALPGGAAARPFITRHNSLGMDLYLRIAPELYLKRLLVGGMERVYELNRNFRNEGLSVRHNPEFTMLEFYQAYADCGTLMDFTEQLLRELLQSLHGSTLLNIADREYDLAQPVRRMTLRESLLQPHTGLGPATFNDAAALQAAATAHGIAPQDSNGALEYALFEKLVEATLQEPIFITAYPIEVSPLSRQCADNPALADRFELFAGGVEIANGFSELNDPEEQAARLSAQAKRRTAGTDAEAMCYDQEFITALEYGMPPAAGEGIGIDRLVMLLAGASAIRDVILFPLLRPERTD